MEVVVCRCCMQQRGDMQPLFGSSIDTMLMAVTSLTVAPEDGLPAKICKRCVLLVSQMFTFKRQCEETDRRLRQSVLLERKRTAEDYPRCTPALERLSSSSEMDGPHGDSIGAMVARQVDSDFSKELTDETSTVNPEEQTVAVLEYLVETTSSNPSYLVRDVDLAATEELYCSPDGDMEYDKLETFQLVNQTSGSDTVATIRSSILIPLHSTDEREIIRNVSSANVAREEPNNNDETTLPGHSCTICRKRFQRSTQLRRHLKTHLATKPHRCNVCGHTAAESSNLKKHMARHTGELRNVTGLPHLCSVCGKRFKFATSLSRHSRVHRKRDIYRCPYCPKSFVERTALLAHTSAHTNRQPYACQQCPKAFTRKVNLARHQRTHSSDKPFHCSLCEKQFSRKSYLDIHQRIHANDKPYLCGDCGKRFVSSSGLVVHRRTHREPDVFGCARCGEHFQRKASLNKHNCD